MITAREAAYALFGAWRLARFDATGVQFFDNTVEAFWRSFYAALIALPGYALLVLLRLAGSEQAVPPLTALTVEAIGYVCGWFAFPLVMFYLARAFNLMGGYFRYIAAYNWAVVLQVTLLLGITAVGAGGILPGPLAALASIAATLAILAYQWFIARAALGVSPAAATGIVLLDLVLGLLINGYANRILMAAAQG